MTEEQLFIRNIIIKYLKKAIPDIVAYELKPSLLKYKFEDDDSSLEDYQINRMKFCREILVHVAPLAYSIANTMAIQLYTEIFERKSELEIMAKEIEEIVFKAMKSLLSCDHTELKKELFEINEKS
jgi:hypothetical protein